MIRILLAEDHYLVRQGLRSLLEIVRDVRVVGEAANGEEALALCRELRPDLAFLDISMPLLNGSQALERIRAEKLPVRVIFLSMHSDEVIVRQVLRAGADGYLLKNAPREELAQAVQTAFQGGIYLSRSLRYILEEGDLPGSRADPLTGLTARELEVLKLLAVGQSNSQIAQALMVSVKTVEKHRASLLAKLNQRDTTGLIRFALQHKLVDLDNSQD